MGKLIISAFSDEYASSFDAQLEAMRGFGVGNIEIRGVDGKNISALTEREVVDAARKLREYGISVSAIGSPLGKINIDGDVPAHLELARRVFWTAAELGTDRIRMFSFYLPEGKSRAECRGRIFSALESLVKLAEEHGVILCHENEAGIYGESPEDCLDIASYFDGRIKCVFDMGNFVLEGYDPMKAYALLRERIEYFHIKDAIYAGAIVPAGCGEAKIAAILNMHKEWSKSDFYASLEPHLQTFDGLNALVGKSFDNPYKYESCESAFTDALARLRKMI